MDNDHPCSSDSEQTPLTPKLNQSEDMTNTIIINNDSWHQVTGQVDAGLETNIMLIWTGLILCKM